MAHNSGLLWLIYRRLPKVGIQANIGLGRFMVVVLLLETLGLEDSPIPTF